MQQMLKQETTCTVCEARQHTAAASTVKKQGSTQYLTHTAKQFVTGALWMSRSVGQLTDVLLGLHQEKAGGAG